MRTTIDLDDELLRQAKHHAARENTTLRQVLESALRAHLELQARSREYVLRWRTEKGRLLPGVRLDDRDALFDPEERLAAVGALAAMDLPVGTPEEMARESVPTPDELMP